MRSTRLSSKHPNRLGRSPWGDDREAEAEILNSPMPPAPVVTPNMDDVRAAGC
jgi:hypothetical protein